MKKILSIITLAAALFAVSVQQTQAQVADYTPTPYVIYNSVASNLPLASISIDCTAQQNIAVEWTLQLNTAGTEVHGIRFIGEAIPGVRPTTPTLADGFYIATAANGTTPVVIHTNFNVKGYSRLECLYMTNGTAGLATNTVRAWVKRNAP